jgi:competence protein ComEC
MTRSKGRGCAVIERPLFFPLLATIAGLTAASLSLQFVPEAVLLPLLVLALCTVFTESRALFLGTISLLVFCAANLSLRPFLLPDFSPTHIVRHCSDEEVVVEGVIDSRPERTERGSRFYLRAERVRNREGWQEATGRMLLSVVEGSGPSVTGDRVRFASRLKRPRNYGLPGEFDMERYMAFRNVFATGFVKSHDEMILIGESGEFRLQRRIDLIALDIGRFIEKHVPGQEGALLRALLLGEMGVVPKAVKDAYTRTGVNHILSISGFHVGIIALFIFHLLLLAAKRSEFLLLHLNLRRFILVLTLPVLAFYLFLAGAAPATVRSVIMIAVYILAMLLERETDPIDSLMLAALIILAGSPAALFDISFQLSFLAFWGILVFTPLLMAPFERLRAKTARKLLLFFMASAAATAATILPVAFYFHRTTLAGLVSNFFIVPLMGYGAVVIGFAALPFVYPVPLLAKLLFLAAAFLIRISDAIIVQLAKIPLLPVFNPSRTELGIFLLFLVAVTFLKGRRARLSCCVALTVIFFGSAIMAGDPAKGKLKITFFSIGQGDSMLVSFPGGERMLIDGGGSHSDSGWDVGERLLAPALWAMGVGRLDYLVLTHPDRDHLQGLKYVAANFRVGEFWTGRNFPESPEYRELLRILAGRGVPVRLVNAAAGPIAIGTARIEPLSPPDSKQAPSSGGPESLNDDSLVFRLVAGEFAALFTGDIGHDVESRLAGRPELLHCTVLKVPHHGSRFSSSPAFLRAAAPAIAVVSAGYRNSYHLPAAETIDRFRRLGIRLYRTDLDGTVEALSERGPGSAVIMQTAWHFH